MKKQNVILQNGLNLSRVSLGKISRKISLLGFTMILKEYSFCSMN